MQQFNKFKGTKGFIRTWAWAVRFRDMIQDTAQQRARILTFWQKHGLAATKEAFSVSRPTLFRWQQALRRGNGRLEGLNKHSTAPKQKRTRSVPDPVKAFILRERECDPRLSKDKLAVMMDEEGVAHLSASTVGRMLADLKKQGVLPAQQPLSFFGKTGTFRERSPHRRTKLRSKGHQGGLVKADTIVRFTNGIKRYVATAIDRESKFGFAAAYPTNSSGNAAEFFRVFRRVSPVPVRHVQTDNGSEFAHHFDLLLAKEGIVHFHAYPRCPRMQSEIERFNRTLLEAFLMRHRQLLAYNLPLFNERLVTWLLWYNTRRPHWSLGLKSPLRYICDSLSTKESQRCWTDTRP